MELAGSSKKKLYLSNSIKEMNVLVEMKQQSINWIALMERFLRSDFISAQNAMEVGDEELAYVSYSSAIYRFIYIRGFFKIVEFSDTDQDECIGRLDELSKSLIRRYKGNSVYESKKLNTILSSEQSNHNQANQIPAPVQKPESTGFLSKIKRLFVGKSEETGTFTDVEAGNEAVTFIQTSTSTCDNGDDEIERMMQKHQYYKIKVREIRNRNERFPRVEIEEKSQKETSFNAENNKHNDQMKQSSYALAYCQKLHPNSDANLRAEEKHSFQEMHQVKVRFGGFPQHCTEAYVLNFFNSYGHVCKFIPYTLSNGRFEGTGEIEYKTREEAAKAVESASGMVINGQPISVTFFSHLNNNHNIESGVAYTMVKLAEVVPKSSQDFDNSVGNSQRYCWANMREENVYNRILFVKFLTQDISSEKELRSLFVKFGSIRYASIGRNVKWAHTGFGKVCFHNAKHTNTAILAMNHYTFPSGAKLFVSRYRFKTARAYKVTNETKQANNLTESTSSDFTNIYVKNFKHIYRNERELSAAFIKFGAIKSARIMRGYKNESLGWGFVCFYDHLNAKTAVEQMNNRVFNHHRLCVRRAYNDFYKMNLRNQYLKQQSNTIRQNKHFGAMPKVNQTCIVCFTENSSEESCILECQHVICKECIVLYIQHLVDNKIVESIICPKDGCHCELSYSHIETIIPSYLMKEYDTCLLNNYLNKTDDIVLCPNAECRFPVFVTSTLTEGICPKCEFTICTKCGEKYHGTFACNEFKSEEEKKRVLDRYMYGSLTEKAELEKKYTKKKLEEEVEKELSNQCIKRKCKQCPICNVNIEKFEGCNKITCAKCKTYFCWLCLKVLDRDDPYRHFDGNDRCILVPMYI